MNLYSLLQKIENWCIPQIYVQITKVSFLKRFTILLEDFFNEQIYINNYYYAYEIY